MTHEVSPDDRNFFDPVTPGNWITGSDGVFTEGTIDETLHAEADQGEQHFTPPEAVDYEGYIDDTGTVHYKRADVIRTEKASADPYAVVVPIPGALTLHGEVLPRELTDPDTNGNKQ
jgi:hypothetical protein